MASKFPIGKMNRKVIIESFSRAPDGQGGFTETWTTFATVSAKIETKSRYEVFRSDQIKPLGDHKITIRWLDGLLETMRITETIGSYHTRIYQIKGIDLTDEKRFKMVLDCKENTET